MGLKVEEHQRNGRERQVLSRLVTQAIRSSPCARGLKFKTIVLFQENWSWYKDLQHKVASAERIWCCGNMVLLLLG